jgi:hypothetical protein
MTDNEHNLEPYQDVLAGLERLAGGLDQQTSPLAAGQIARTCRLAATVRPASFWSCVRVPLTAAAAVLIAVGVAAWMIWPGEGSHGKTISVVSNTSVGRQDMPAQTWAWHPLATATAASQPLAESQAISFTVPSISLPSLWGTSSQEASPTSQTAVQVPSLPKSESIELKFEIPSITFPTLTERGNNEM